MSRRYTTPERIALGPDETWDRPNATSTTRNGIRLLRERILQEPYLETDDVVRRAHIADVETAVQTGELLAYRDHGNLLFPAFQFDPATSQPLPAVTEVNRIMGAAHDGWGVTGWWTNRNAWLEGAPAPVELLGNTALHPMLVRLAEGTIHGD